MKLLNDATCAVLLAYVNGALIIKGVCYQRVREIYFPPVSMAGLVGEKIKKQMKN